MITLGLDTSGAWCSAAIVDEARLIASCTEKIGRGHAERLAPMVNDLLSLENIKAQEIQRVAVCTGPGSFTGLRVALAFARGFALPRKIPVIGLSALEVLAAQIDPHQDKRVVSVMDVRRGQLCWAAYDGRAEIQTPVTMTIPDAKTNIKKLGYDRLVGDGATYFDQENSISHISPSALAWISMDHNPQSRPANPLYSRPPDAKLPGGISL